MIGGSASAATQEKRPSCKNLHFGRQQQGTTTTQQQQQFEFERQATDDRLLRRETFVAQPKPEPPPSRRDTYTAASVKPEDDILKQITSPLNVSELVHQELMEGSASTATGSTKDDETTVVLNDDSVFKKSDEVSMMVKLSPEFQEAEEKKSLRDEAVALIRERKGETPRGVSKGTCVVKKKLPSPQHLEDILEPVDVSALVADAAADGVEAVGGGVTIGLDHTDNAAPALDISGLVEMRIEEVVKVNIFF